MGTFLFVVDFGFCFFLRLCNFLGLGTTVASGHNICRPLLAVTEPIILGGSCTPSTQLSIKQIIQVQRSCVDRVNGYATLRGGNWDAWRQKQWQYC